MGRFSASGDLLRESPSEQVGTWLVPLSRMLFLIGPGDTCTAPVPVWAVNERTLRTTVIASLEPPGNTCAGQPGFRSVGAVGNSIFALFGVGPGSTLYRVTPLMRSRAQLMRTGFAVAGSPRAEKSKYWDRRS